MLLSACNPKIYGLDWRSRVRFYQIGVYEEEIGMKVDIEEEKERFVVVKNDVWEDNDLLLFSFRCYNFCETYYDKYLNDYYNEHWDDRLSEQENSNLGYQNIFTKELEYTDENGDIIEFDENGYYWFYGDKTFYVSYQNANENLKKSIQESILNREIKFSVSDKKFAFYDLFSD